MAAEDKNVTDEFMLKEYESIAAAHFDSQDGLRQQFRFYLIIAAVPLTVVGLVTKEQQAGQVQQIGAWDLPRLVGVVLVGIGMLGVLMLISMMHTKFDATLYARTVNGIRNYFWSRAKTLGTDLDPYLNMPRSLNEPSYFRLRAFFWQVILVSLINSAYLWFGMQTAFKTNLAPFFIVLFALPQFLIYMFLSIARQREKKKV
jgi:hypothetical protein